MVLVSSMEILREERGDLVERDDVDLVIEVAMIRAGNDQQFLIVAFQFLERALAEIAAVRFFAVDEQNRSPDLTGIGKEFRVQKGLTCIG